MSISVFFEAFICTRNVTIYGKMFICVPFFVHLDFPPANRQSGINFFDPKTLQKASIIHFWKSQEFSGEKDLSKYSDNVSLL